MAAMSGPTATGSFPLGTIGGGGKNSEGSAFAALIAGLLGGNALPEAAQGVSLLGLLGALTTDAPATENATAAPEEGEALSLETALEQLAAWIGSLSAEQQQKLAQHPQVSEWMAHAEAELTMAGESIEAAYFPVLGNQAAEALAKPIDELLRRLASALEGDAEQQPYLAAVAKQATSAVAQAVIALEQSEGFLTAVTAGASQGKAAKEGEASPGAKAVAAEIERLLAKTGGSVETNAQPKAEGGSTNVRVSHLSAMEAKAALLPVVAVKAAAVSTGAETSSASAEKASGETQTSMANVSDTQKSAPESAKAEAAPRIPLSQAAERLQDWMMKQTANGGSLKAETVLKLMPEHLGQVEVKLSMQNGQLAATITTESAMAKDVLESNLSMLRSSLQNQGVTVERLVVAQQQPSGFQSGMFQDGGQQQRQSAGRDGSRDGQSRKEQGAEDWAETLAIGGDLEAAFMEGLRNGSSFRAQA